MAFEKTVVPTFTVAAAGADTPVTFPLKWDYALLRGLSVKVQSDTTTIMQITDGRGKVVYLDAAAADYATARRYVVPSPDVTTTGITGNIPKDSTGAAVTIGLGASPLVKSPLTLTVKSGTAAETVDAEVYTEGPLDSVSYSVTVPNPAASVETTVSLPGAKYTQIVGFSAQLTGTDALTRIRLRDADGFIFYLDAADVDYKTAKVYTLINLDDTLTGLGPVHVDATGAAATATAAAALPVVKAPIRLQVINGGTAGDVVAGEIIYRR